MRRERRSPSPLRGVLLFLLGALLGANAMYYAMTHAIGRRFGLHGDAGETRIETPLPLPQTPVGASETALPASTSSSPQAVAPAATPAPTATPSTASPSPAIPASATRLLLPVQGVRAEQLLDTFSDARSEGRSHDAIDIMAAAGTPVLAVADGSVEKLFTSKQGGLTLYQFDTERTVAYYYAHLQGYAAGIAEKRIVKRGDVLGYVGSTGNANPAAPHLHFAIFVLGPEKKWWQGQAINPYPLLGGKPKTP